MPLETIVNQAETSSAAPHLPINMFRSTPEGRELDLSRAAVVLARHKKKILLSATITTVLMAIVVFLLLKPTYTAEAVFLPPHTSPGSGLAQLATQSDPMSALIALGGIKNPAEIYVGILKSRTIADKLIKQFDLQQIYKEKKLSDAEKALKKHSKFELGKDTLVTISVKDHDPRRAAALANAYLAELTAQNGRLAITGASQRRLFFERQLQTEEKNLSDAEVALKSVEEQTGIIAPKDQSMVAIAEIEQTRAQMKAREIALSALMQSNTDQSPDVIRVQAEIATLKDQLKQLQDGHEEHQPGNIQHPTAKVPALELEYVRKERDVKYHEFLFNMLAKQYEAARLNEAREAPVLQVVDTAVVPDKRSGPPRTLLLIGAFFAGAFAGCLWALSKNFLEYRRAARRGSAEFVG